MPTKGLMFEAETLKVHRKTQVSYRLKILKDAEEKASNKSLNAAKYTDAVLFVTISLKSDGQTDDSGKYSEHYIIDPSHPHELKYTKRERVTQNLRAFGQTKEWDKKGKTNDREVAAERKNFFLNLFEVELTSIDAAISDCSDAEYRTVWNLKEWFDALKELAAEGIYVVSARLESIGPKGTCTKCQLMFHGLCKSMERAGVNFEVVCRYLHEAHLSPESLRYYGNFKLEYKKESLKRSLEEIEHWKMVISANTDIDNFSSPWPFAAYPIV